MFPSRRFIPPLVALAGLAVLAAGIGGCDKLYGLVYGDRCVLSGRVIHPGMAVRVAVEGGRQGRACCLRCAITEAEQTGKKVTVLSVTDFDTGKPLSPRDAIYVVGSNINMCTGPPFEASSGRHECVILGWDRCSPSALAFANADEAQAFQQAHGGGIETFAQVIGPAKVVASR
jgi:hypothetical protein